MLLSLEFLVTAKGPMPDLTALNEAALAYLVEAIKFNWERYASEDMEDMVYEQMKAVRREAMWDRGISPAEEERKMAEMAEELEEGDAGEIFEEYMDSRMFWAPGRPAFYGHRRRVLLFRAVLVDSPRCHAAI
jgi:hypothetical protein